MCSETLALSVIAEKALPPLVTALGEEPEDHLRSATAWTLGQIGRHTPDHAKAVSDTGGPRVWTRTARNNVVTCLLALHSQLVSVYAFVRAFVVHGVAVEHLDEPDFDTATWTSGVIHKRLRMQSTMYILQT